jgi:hypothetical protein
MWNHQEITTVIATNNFIRDHQNRAAKRQSGNKKFNKIVLMEVDSKPLSRLFIDDQQLIV